jgi:large conductance mechanosensitive channel
VTWNFGNFTQSLINFIIISTVLFFIVKGESYVSQLSRELINSNVPLTKTAYVTAFRHKKAAVSTKPCQFCTKDIPIKAVRCPECTSRVPNDIESATDGTSLLETKIMA